MSFDPLPFIIAAYVVTLGGLGGLLAWALVRMRRAEQALNGPAERALDGDR
ncbi:MAG: heme exporter protein CcmD [Sandaracinobacter sp.]